MRPGVRIPSLGPRNRLPLAGRLVSLSERRRDPPGLMLFNQWPLAAVAAFTAAAAGGSNPFTRTKTPIPLWGVGVLPLIRGIRTGAGVNDVPGARQSRDPASAAAEVESLQRRHGLRIVRDGVFFFAANSVFTASRRNRRSALALPRGAVIQLTTQRRAYRRTAKDSTREPAEAKNV